MIIPETPPQAFWPAKAISNDQDDELLERALGEFMKQDQWIDDFIKRLKYTIEDIVRKQRSNAASIGDLLYFENTTPLNLSKVINTDHKSGTEHDRLPPSMLQRVAQHDGCRHQRGFKFRQLEQTLPLLRDMRRRDDPSA